MLDAAGSERAALLGVFDGAALAVLFAAKHPERVAALALYAGLAKFTQGDGYDLGWSPAAIQLYLSATEEGWGSATAPRSSRRAWQTTRPTRAGSPGSCGSERAPAARSRSCG